MLVFIDESGHPHPMIVPKIRYYLVYVSMSEM